MLKVSGIFVSPLEVEGVLLQHPRVLEAAVVGEENEAGLVRPLAYVVLKGQEGRAREEIEGELIAHVKMKLAHYKAPGRVEFVAELPRSDRGKVLRRALRT